MSDIARWKQLADGIIRKGSGNGVHWKDYVALARELRAAAERAEEAERISEMRRSEGKRILNERNAFEVRVVELEAALAKCLQFAPGGIDDVPDRQGPAVVAWAEAWALIEGTKADWRSRADLAVLPPAEEETE